MQPSAQISSAERLGQSWGRGWRSYLRQERKVSGWLVAQGLPASVANASLLVVKLVLLGVLLYLAFWLALLLVFAVLAEGAAQHGALDDESEPVIEPDELTELRNTPGYDPNLYNDTSHEMHEDD
ncbi:TPA: DUF3742 family protein [Pseudomonas aeruginosa]|nr:DUF3742 family protein [Pseudomonas aeruginosa]